MSEYYFDMETTGLDPLNNKIISFQWQQLSGSDGKPLDDLKILKEWESSEEEILRRFLPVICTENPFDFIMVGKNLIFDFMFLNQRAQAYGLKGFSLQKCHERCWIDLKPILIMINRGRFKGYDRVIDKNGSLTKVNVPKLYKEKKYSEIINYIQDESTVFLRAFQTLKKEMPSLKVKL